MRRSRVNYSLFSPIREARAQSGLSSEGAVSPSEREKAKCYRWYRGGVAERLKAPA